MRDWVFGAVAAEDEGHVARHPDERARDLFGGRDEDVAVEQVERGIADHGELRNHHHVGSGTSAFFIYALDHFRVRGERAHCGIDLSDVDFHATCNS